MRYNIAIDGPAGAGKSTIAKRLAKELGAIYVDTGAMYRAMAYYFIQKGVDKDDIDTITKLCKDVEVSISYENGEQQVILNGENITGFIRQEAVGNMASATSVYPVVREKLVELHEKTVSDEARRKTAAYYKSLENEEVDYVDYDDLNDDGTIGFAVKYTLKNGKTVTRRYEVASSVIIDEYVAAVQNKEVLNQTSLNEESFKNIYFSYFSYYQNDEFGIYEETEGETVNLSSAYHDSYNNQLTAEQAEKLRELLIEDRLNETKYEFIETQGELFSIIPPYYRQVTPAVAGVLCNYRFSPELSEEKRSELMAVEEEKRSSIIRSYEAGEQDCMDENGCYLFESKSYEILPYDSNSCEYLKSLGLKLK